MITSDSMKTFRMAERLSVPQLVMAIKRGTVDPVIGQLVLNNKVQQQKKMAQAQAAQQPQRPPVAQENMMAGISQLPTQREMFADDSYSSGGIVGYAEGGPIIDDSRRPALGEGILETPIGQFLHSLQFEDITEGPRRKKENGERREVLKDGLKNIGRALVGQPLRESGAARALLGLPMLQAARDNLDRPGVAVGSGTTDTASTMPLPVSKPALPESTPTSESASASRSISLGGGIPGATMPVLNLRSAREAAVGAPSDRAERMAALSKQREGELAAGDKEAFSGIKEILEGQKGSLSKSDKQNMWLALIKGGLAAAAGNSQYALQNIAAGGESGVEQYIQQNIINRQREQQLARDEQAMRLNELGTAKDNRSMADRYAQTIAGLEQGDQALAMHQANYDNQNEIARAELGLRAQQLNQQAAQANAMMRYREQVAAAKGAGKAAGGKAPDPIKQQEFVRKVAADFIGGRAGQATEASLQKKYGPNWRQIPEAAAIYNNAMRTFVGQQMEMFSTMAPGGGESGIMGLVRHSSEY